MMVIVGNMKPVVMNLDGSYVGLIKNNSVAEED